MLWRIYYDKGFSNIPTLSWYRIREILAFQKLYCVILKVSAVSHHKIMLLKISPNTCCSCCRIDHIDNIYIILIKITIWPWGNSYEGLLCYVAYDSIVNNKLCYVIVCLSFRTKLHIQGTLFERLTTCCDGALN
jgi:hypothetical protein